jgi:hypothetical protein
VTPVCDEGSETCVECLEPAHCTAPEDQCDAASKTCVECLTPSDCASASASRCQAGACTPCSSHADCAHIAGKSVCDGGECVECTGTDYAACGEDAGTPLVCDSLSQSCSTKKQASAGLCQTCVSDAQCKAGQLCVMQRFGSPERDVGYFCFWKKAAGTGGAPALCSSVRPFVETLVNQTSIDQATGDVCGLAVSTCLAHNEFRSKNCTTSMAPDDSKCGFDAPDDAKCAEFDTGVHRCTMTCLSDDDCRPGSSCDISTTPAVCEL